MRTTPKRDNTFPRARCSAEELADFEQGCKRLDMNQSDFQRRAIKEKLAREEVSK